jgi:hypothetical protein
LCYDITEFNGVVLSWAVKQRRTFP